MENIDSLLFLSYQEGEADAATERRDIGSFHFRKDNTEKSNLEKSR